MKILSIDFDYFQDIPDAKNISLYYPDGVDHPTYLSEIIWGSKYAFHKKEIEQTMIREDELFVLENMLLAQNEKIPVLITQSHKHIYDFVNEHKDDNLTIMNADLHHDIINNNKCVDCGNWAGHLIKENEGANFLWITHPLSKEVYGFTEQDSDVFDTITLSGLSKVKNEKFDAVFLCRSDNWFPPHLDKYFVETVSLIKDKFDNVILEKDVDKPRNYYLKEAKQIKNFIAKETTKDIL